MNKEINTYNSIQVSTDKEICDLLAKIIDNELKEAESKIWHAHPVWFLEGNPIVGYSKEKILFACFFGVVNLLKKNY